MKRASSPYRTPHKRQCLDGSAKTARTQSEQRAQEISDWLLGTGQPHKTPVPYSDTSSSNSLSSPAWSSYSNQQDEHTKEPTRSRSQPDTLDPLTYRNVVLKQSNIRVDVFHHLPYEVESRLPRRLRGFLDSSPHANQQSDATTTRTTSSPQGHESDSERKNLERRIKECAEAYREDCRELARKPGSEPGYSTYLYIDVVKKLVTSQYWRWRPTLQFKGKPWSPLLRPPAPVPSTSYQRLPPQAAAMPKPLVEPNIPTEIAIPKPDITVGLSLNSFMTFHVKCLNNLQSTKGVLSDPHAEQGDLRFPFLLFQSEDPSMHGNLMGAQNQAAIAGACAGRMIESLYSQSRDRTPNIVFSVTSECAVHELWVHFRLVGDPTYHMTCLRAWRTTMEHESHDFVTTLAIIIEWGYDSLYSDIEAQLDTMC